jgi:hypothetical protein
MRVSELSCSTSRRSASLGFEARGREVLRWQVEAWDERQTGQNEDQQDHHNLWLLEQGSGNQWNESVRQGWSDRGAEVAGTSGSGWLR